MVARLILLAVCFGTAWGQESKPQYLKHEALKEFFSQARTVKISIGTTRFIGVYTEDGTARLDWGSGGAKGAWRINGDKFCTKYPGIRRGYETCYDMQKTGDQTYTLYDDFGAINSTWAIDK